jgi:hypothetical protein
MIKIIDNIDIDKGSKINSHLMFRLPTFNQVPKSKKIIKDPFLIKTKNKNKTEITLSNKQKIDMIIEPFFPIWLPKKNKIKKLIKGMKNIKK